MNANPNQEPIPTIDAPRGHRSSGSESGQALVEFIIVFPVLLLLLFGIIEMGAAWRTYQVTTNAAREGARMTVLPDADEDEIRDAIDERLLRGGLTPASASIEFDCSGGDCFGAGRSPGDPAEVRVAYPFQFAFLGPIMDWMGATDAIGSVTMETGFVMRVE
jgi:hypothetical protein